MFKIYNIYNKTYKNVYGQRSRIGKKTSKIEKKLNGKITNVTKRIKSIIKIKQIKQLYAKFQDNLNQFAKEHKNEINSDSKFR